MASLDDVELKNMTQDERAKALGMTTEQLTGRSLFIEFKSDEEERFLYPWAPDVDINKRSELDVGNLTITEINNKIRELMDNGHGTIVIKNPRGKHSLGVGILSRLNLIIEGSLGYFVGSRTGIDMKGGTIIVGGDTGALSGFMMQRGRIIVCGNAGKNLGDSMYDGIIYVGGDIKSLGVDAVTAELTQADSAWLSQKLKLYDLLPKEGVDHFTKIVAGKQLWNYDNLEPTEKKLIL